MAGRMTNPALSTNYDTAETKSRLRNRRQAAVQGPLFRRDTGGEGAVLDRVGVAARICKKKGEKESVIAGK